MNKGLGVFSVGSGCVESCSMETAVALLLSSGRLVVGRHIFCSSMCHLCEFSLVSQRKHVKKS